MAFATKPKPPVSHKKRTGKHHRRSDQYAKHYWPYLPMLAIVAVGLLISAWWPKNFGVLGTSSDLTSQSLLTGTNEQRLATNEAQLSLDSQLSQAAQAKAEDMVKQNYWSHNTPSGATPWTFVQQTGYSYQAAGENLAYGFNNTTAAMNAWMHSPEHRKNILNSAFQQVGFGIASSPNYIGHGPSTVIVAMYAQPTTVVATAPDSAVKAATTAPQQVSRLAVLSGNQASLATMTVACLMSLAAVIIVVRHGKLLRRSLVQGEQFVLHHPGYDFLLVAVVTTGFVITRAAGVIL